jgi:hypothetical protein
MTLTGVSAVILQGLLRQSLGLGFYLAVLAFIVGIALFVLWLYRFIELLSLRYQVDRNALVIDAGLSRYTIPLDAIDRIATGADFTLRRFRGFDWPGFVKGRAQVDGLPLLHLLGTEPFERQLVIVTRQAAYGISPPSPADFAEAIERRRALGAIRRASETIERKSLATWAVWRDSLFWAIVAVTLIANLALFGLIFSRYGALPERISIHYNALGEVDRVSSKVWLLAMPTIGALALVLNASIGLALHARERAGSILLSSASLALQVVLWLATLGILAT